MEDQENIVTTPNGAGGTMGLEAPVWEGAENFVRSDEGGSFDPRIRPPKQMPWEEQKRLKDEAIAARTVELRAKDSRNLEFAQQPSPSAPAAAPKVAPAHRVEPRTGAVIQAEVDQQILEGATGGVAIGTAGQPTLVFTYNKETIFMDVPSLPSDMLKALEKRDTIGMDQIAKHFPDIVDDMRKRFYDERSIAAMNGVVGDGVNDVAGMPAVDEDGSYISQTLESKEYDMDKVGDVTTSTITAKSQSNLKLTLSKVDELSNRVHKEGGDRHDVVAALVEDGALDGIDDPNQANLVMGQLYEQVRVSDMGHLQAQVVQNETQLDEDMEDVDFQVGQDIERMVMGFDRMVASGMETGEAASAFSKGFSDLFHHQIDTPTERQLAEGMVGGIISRQKGFAASSQAAMTNALNSGDRRGSTSIMLRDVILPQAQGSINRMGALDDRQTRAMGHWFNKLGTAIGKYDRGEPQMLMNEFPKMHDMAVKQANIFHRGAQAEKFKNVREIMGNINTLREEIGRGRDLSTLSFPVKVSVYDSSGKSKDRVEQMPMDSRSSIEAARQQALLKIDGGLEVEGSSQQRIMINDFFNEAASVYQDKLTDMLLGDKLREIGARDVADLPLQAGSTAQTKAVDRATERLDTRLDQGIAEAVASSGGDTAGAMEAVGAVFEAQGKAMKQLWNSLSDEQKLSLAKPAGALTRTEEAPAQ